MCDCKGSGNLIHPEILLVQHSTCHVAEKCLVEQSILLDEYGKLLLFARLPIF